MCEARERLIGYIYDECDADERRAVDAHLEQCPECRGEIQALRQVRSDLLAWEVTGTPDVWRPFPAAAQTTWWQQVPAWAMAAAAGLVLAAGVVGGASARALASAPVAPVAAEPAAPVVAGITPADLAAAQQRILDLVRSELDQRAARAGLGQNVRLVSQGRSEPALEQVRELSRDNEVMGDALFLLYKENLAYREKTDQLIRSLQEQLAAHDFALRNSLLAGGGAGAPR